MDPIVWESFPDYGDLMSVDEFAQSVEDGSFIDYDGYGYWAVADKMSDVVVRPSTVDDKPEWATHVIWFNR